MYSKQEMVKLRESFWTAFGRYMSPVPSADGQKVNWVNYKTGVKHIRFIMEVKDKEALIGIMITHPEADLRGICYNKFLQLKKVFTNTVGNEWIWETLAYDESGKPASRIYIALPDKTIKIQQDWPSVISFFKTHIMALDEFWQMVKEGFEP